MVVSHRVLHAPCTTSNFPLCRRAPHRIIRRRETNRACPCAAAGGVRADALAGGDAAELQRGLWPGVLRGGVPAAAAVVGGIANGLAEALSPTGEVFVGLRGAFRFEPVDGSEVLTAPVLWLPTGFDDDIKTLLTPDSETGEPNIEPSILN